MRIITSARHHAHATTGLTIHGEKYPELPARVDVILETIQKAGLGPVEEPGDHGLGPILAVHAQDYVGFLTNIYVAGRPFRHSGEAVMADTFVTRHARRQSPHPWAQLGAYAFDIEAPFLPGTWEAAYWSAQVALTGAARLQAGERAVYALGRPPGHHALTDQAGGFCYLNNAAIAARALQRTGERVAILDVDYHHGNGTQEIFYADPEVFFVSLHAHPDEDYPFFWGAADETGAGPGQGRNLNLPLPKGTDDAAYLNALEQALAAIAAFAPRYLVLSLGLDIGAGDPSALGGGFAISGAGFAAIGRRVAALGRPTLIVQEGGYRLDTLGANALAVLGGWAR